MMADNRCFQKTAAVMAGAALLAGCGGDSGRLTVDEETLIPVDKLVKTYGWDEDYILWRWDAGIMSGSMTGGNVWMFAPEMTSRRGGIAFSFGSNAELFGRTCIGNLALDGEANLAADGLLLRKGATLIYQGAAGPSPCSGPIASQPDDPPTDEG